MATPAQILANQTNARLSTGPKTDEGKRASSRNSCRHGLTGTQIVMPGEDAAAYEKLRKGMHESYRPANDPERVLVDQISANAWRLMRAQRVETAFMTKLAEGADNADMAIAAALLDRPRDLARIARYITAAENAYYKAIRELDKLQKARALAEEHDALIESYMQSSGFVSKVESRAREQAEAALPQPEQTAAATAPAPPAARYAMPLPLRDAPSAPLYAAC
jgi:hypothetical protein